MFLILIQREGNRDNRRSTANHARPFHCAQEDLVAIHRRWTQMRQKYDRRRPQFRRRSYNAVQIPLLFGNDFHIGALRLLETTKVKGAVLVSACHTDLGIKNERKSGYYKDPWLWEDIKRNADWIVQFGSEVPRRLSCFLFNCLSLLCSHTTGWSLHTLAWNGACAYQPRHWLSTLHRRGTLPGLWVPSATRPRHGKDPLQLISM